MVMKLGSFDAANVGVKESMTGTPESRHAPNNIGSAHTTQNLFNFMSISRRACRRGAGFIARIRRQINSETASPAAHGGDQDWRSCSCSCSFSNFWSAESENRDG